MTTWHARRLDRTGTPEFLPRLAPAVFGAFPRGPFAAHWTGVVYETPFDVASQRPIHGASSHLIADDRGQWLAYRHNMKTGRRQRVGNSARWSRMATLWNVHP